MDYVAHVREDGSRQWLHEHLLGVAKLARQNTSKIDIGVAGELLGLLHDLGKYSEEFQNYLKSATGLLNQDEDEEFVDASRLRGRIDHSSAGAQLVWRELSKQGGMGNLVGQIFALCIASRHSGLIDCLALDGHDVFSARMNKPSQRTHFDESLASADPHVLDRVRALLADPAIVTEFQTRIKKIIASAPNAVSNSTIVQQQWGLLVRYLFSCLVDADRLDTANFEKQKAGKHRMNGRYEDWRVLVDRFETHLSALTPRQPIDDLRADISKHCLEGASRNTGIFTLTVPTGGGKTLASLRFALHHACKHRMDRVIYVIPFTSIIAQNADVVRRILEPASSPESKGRIVLEHHSNLTAEQRCWRQVNQTCRYLLQISTRFCVG